jgi:hypothetical protein
MKRLWTATVVATLLSYNCAFSPAFSQVGGMADPTPGIAATSPLGVVPGASVRPTGIPLGATELASPGLSPLTDGTVGMAGFGSTCSAVGSPSSGISGASTYDGGGMGLGMGASLPGSGVICGASSSGSTSSTAAIFSTASGNAARTGIPFGSVEIGNAGISPLVVVPTPSASPSMMGTLGPSPSTTIGTSTTPSMLGAPTMPSVMGTVGLSTNQTAMPCGTIVTGGPAMNC